MVRRVQTFQVQTHYLSGNEPAIMRLIAEQIECRVTECRMYMGLNVRVLYRTVHNAEYCIYVQCRIT